jgi:hypothetical protein
MGLKVLLFQIILENSFTYNLTNRVIIYEYISSTDKMAVSDELERIWRNTAHILYGTLLVS